MTRKLRISTGIRIMGGVVLLLSLSLASVVYLATDLFIQDNTALIKETTLETSTTLALHAKETLRNLTDNMRILGQQWAHQPNDPSNRLLLASLGNDHPILATWIETFSNVPLSSNHGPVYFTAENPDPNFAREKLLTKLETRGLFHIVELAQGNFQLATTTLEDGEPILMLGVPLERNSGGTGYANAIIAAIRYRKVFAALGTSNLSTSYIVDSKGRIVAHPEWERLQGEANAQSEIVRQVLEGKHLKGSRRFVDPQTKEIMLGTFQSTEFLGLTVITEIPEARVLEAPKRAQFRATLICLIALSVAIILTNAFIVSLKNPSTRSNLPMATVIYANLESCGDATPVLSAIIENHYGKIDEKKGSIIVAKWESALASESGSHALYACLEIRNHLNRLGLKISIGLELGVAINSNVASLVRDASQLENRARQLGKDVLVSEMVQSKLRHHFVFESAGEDYSLEGYFDPKTLRAVAVPLRQIEVKKAG